MPALSEGLEARLDTEMVAVVRVAVALCLISEPAAGMKVLAGELERDKQWNRLHAAIALDEMDEQAREVIAALRKGLVKQLNK